MTDWQAPVVDRCQRDIDERTEKGCFEAADLNRLEGNSAHLAGVLGLGVEPPGMERRDGSGMASNEESTWVKPHTGWQAGDLVFEADMRRICACLGAIYTKSAALHPAENPGWLPQPPAAPLVHFTAANNAELLQLRALRAAEGNEGELPLCGEWAAGEEMGVI